MPQPHGGVHNERYAEKEGLEREFEIASAATSREAEGSPVSGPVRTILSEMGISCSGKTARKLTPDDYNNYDLIIGMDEDNIHDMRRIFGGNSKGKLHLLLEYAGCADSVADPWYTCDYEATRRDVIAGCKGLLEHLTKTKES